MGAQYTQFTLEERCAVARLQAAGHSLRQIAAALGRAPSSVAREVTRNAGRQVGYAPVYAEQQARARRWHGLRLERDVALQDQVLARLKAGWSPAQVVGRLAREAGQPVLSHETIYRFLYAQIRRTNDYTWRHYLPRAKSDRGWRGRKGGIENAIGRLRRTLPRKTDLATLTPTALDRLVAQYNHTPRACLDYQTPAEVFGAHLSHFNCDSTFPLSRE